MSQVIDEKVWKSTLDTALSIFERIESGADDHGVAVVHNVERITANLALTASFVVLESKFSFANHDMLDNCRSSLRLPLAFRCLGPPTTRVTSSTAVARWSCLTPSG